MPIEVITDISFFTGVFVKVIACSAYRRSSPRKILQFRSSEIDCPYNCSWGLKYLGMFQKELHVVNKKTDALAATSRMTRTRMRIS